MIGDVDKRTLPGRERLNTPGKKEGETTMVLESGKVVAYQWTSGSWVSVGEVTDTVDDFVTFQIELDNRVCVCCPGLETAHHFVSFKFCRLFPENGSSSQKE
jgi:hypothetical protein